MRILGAILVVLGVLALVYGGIRYTKQEKVVDVGPIEATVEHKKTIPLPPLAGAAAVVAGIILISRRDRVA
jgi:drug/metabolite transporter (DMT)-like permease